MGRKFDWERLEYNSSTRALPLKEGNFVLPNGEFCSFEAIQSYNNKNSTCLISIPKIRIGELDCHSLAAFFARLAKQMAGDL